MGGVIVRMCLGGGYLGTDTLAIWAQTPWLSGHERAGQLGFLWDDV